MTHPAVQVLVFKIKITFNKINEIVCTSLHIINYALLCTGIGVGTKEELLNRLRALLEPVSVNSIFN